MVPGKLQTAVFLASLICQSRFQATVYSMNGALERSFGVEYWSGVKNLERHNFLLFAHKMESKLSVQEMPKFFQNSAEII